MNQEEFYLFGVKIKIPHTLTSGENSHLFSLLRLEKAAV